MKLSKLTLAVVTALGASVSYSAFAIDLYVNTKTKQIFAEPGKNRVKMGSFEQIKNQGATANKSEMDEIRQDLELKNNAIKALEEHINESPKDAAEIKMGDKGIEFESKDGNFKFAINGRLQVDAQVNTSNGTMPATGTSTPNRLADGVNLRRARLGIEGTMYKDFDYKFEYDFSRGNGTVASGITDAYLGWNISKPFSIKVGQFKEPFSMEEATSNRFLTFIERNQAVNSFSDNPNSYKVGLGANYVEDNYGIMAAVQTETVGGGWANNSSVNGGLTAPSAAVAPAPNNGNNGAAALNTGSNFNGSNSRSNGAGDTSWDVTARTFGRPWMEDKTKFLHIGASGSYRNINNNYTADGNFNNGGMAFTSTPNGNVDRTGILNTGNLTNGKLGAKGAHRVDNVIRFGGEAAVVYGPFSAQAEYLETRIGGTGYKGETLTGYYAYTSYFLTGESRNYKSKTGAWDRIKPSKNFDGKGGWGAWEIAAGYDYLNLNSKDIRGGRASTAKIGLNWYINPRIRVMADYIHVLDISTTGTSAGARAASFNNTNPDIFEMRAQIDW